MNNENFNVGTATATNLTRNHTSSPKLQGPIGVVVSSTIAALRPLVDCMFINVDDFLFSIAEKSDNSEFHTMSFDAMRRIRAHRDTILEKFFVNMDKAIQNTWNRPTRSTTTAPHVVKNRFNRDDMTVLDDDEMEVAAAVSGIVSKGNMRYGSQLGSLTRTLNSISKHTAVDETTNPIGVSSITRAFNDAIKHVSLDVQIVLYILKLFERDVTERLGDIYSGALEQLEKSGIALVDYAADDGAVVDERVRDVRQRRHRGTTEFADLRRYLSSKARNSDSRPGKNMGFADVGQLLDIVSAVQDQYLEQFTVSNAGNQSSFPNLQSFLLILPTEQGGFQNADEAERDTLRLVSDLFEHMFRNENLSLASKALIARLQMPVLKVALLDKSIFSDVDHPTRQLLNRLAIDGVGWPTNAVLLEKNRLYLAAEELVRRINDEFSDDISIFDRLLGEWNDMAASKRGRVENAERRINEAALGKAKLNAAKGIVQNVVNTRVSGSRLPRAVASFLTLEWTNTLVMTCINFGTDSDEWQMVNDTLDTLLAACQPAERREDVELRRRNLTDLVSRLDEGLQLSGSTAVEAQGLLDGIVAAIEQVTSDDDDWFSGTTEYRVENLQIAEEITITDVDRTEKPTAQIGPLSTLQPGDWIEIDGSDSDGPFRCKLIVIVDETRTYVFGNDVGLKVCEKSADELAQGLAAGDVRIIHEELLVERALDELLIDLQPTVPV